MMQMAGDGELGRKLYPAAMAWVWAMKKQTWNPEGPTATENYRAFMEQRILETGYERQLLIEHHMNYVAMGRGRDAGELCYDTYRLAQVRNYQWSRATSECYNLPPPSFYAPSWPGGNDPAPPRGCATESALIRMRGSVCPHGCARSSAPSRRCRASPCRAGPAACRCVPTRGP